jgi:hypothetical protein
MSWLTHQASVRCAIGSSFVTRTDLEMPPDATNFFSSRAKLLLDIEMDSPSVATVQALVIMSATAVSCCFHISSPTILLS